MRDIARELGITITTVSRALNDKPDIAPETKARILETANRLGYVHSALGRGLAAGYVNAVGCIVTSIADPFVAGILDGIERVAQSAGLAMLISTSHGDPSLELLAVDTLRSFRVAGVITTSSLLSAAQFEQVRQMASPIVLINTETSNGAASSIRIDNDAVAHSAVDHLYQLGHRRIAHISCDDRSASSIERERGYRAALADHGLAYDPALVIASDDSVPGGARAVSDLLAREGGPTAIFCYNDHIAIGALNGLRRAGMRVPDDVCVVGVDDIEMATWVTPSLTTIRQPSRKMGESAMNMLLRAREGDVDVTDVVFGGELIERESTTPKFNH